MNWLASLTLLTTTNWLASRTPFIIETTADWLVSLTPSIRDYSWLASQPNTLHYRDYSWLTSQPDTLQYRDFNWLANMAFLTTATMVDLPVSLNFSVFITETTANWKASQTSHCRHWHLLMTVTVWMKNQLLMAKASLSLSLSLSKLN